MGDVFYLKRLDVVPMTTAGDGINRRKADAVLDCDGFGRLARVAPCADGKHICHAQYGHGVTFSIPSLPGSDRSRMAPLANHVRCVVSDRPKKKMVGAHARWIVATVADEEAFRDLAVVQKPGDSMRSQKRRAATAFPKLTIAKAPWSHPQPAVVSLSNVTPETIGESHGWSLLRPSAVGGP